MSKKGVSLIRVVVWGLFFCFVSSVFASYRMPKRRKVSAKYNKFVQKVLVAVHTGDIGFIRSRITSNNVNKQCSDYGLSLLHYACKTENPKDEMIRYLIRIGAEIDNVDINGRTPLDYLYRNQKLTPDIAKNILPDLVEHPKFDPNRLLITKGVNLKIIYLVFKLMAHKKSEKINYEGELGYTPLALACKNKGKNFIRFLLDNGAKESIAKPSSNKFCMRKGITALHLACMHQGHEVVAGLIARGGRQAMHAPMKNGDTPFSIACRHQKDIKSIVCLIESGANIKLKQSVTQRTPLHELCTNKHINCDMLKLLLSSGVDPNSLDRFEETPLHLLLKNKNAKLDIIKLLTSCMSSKAINKKSKKSHTPLTLACRFTSPEIIVNIMPECKETVLVQDDLGRTPLHLALQYQTKEVVAVLLQSGAMQSIRTKDVYGKAPVYYITESLQQHKDVLIFIFLQLLGFSKNYFVVVQNWLDKLLRQLNSNPLRMQELFEKIGDIHLHKLKASLHDKFEAANRAK